MDTPTSRRHRQAGFTLVEIMVVIVIIGLLATLVAPNVLGLSEDAKIKKATADVKTIQEAVKMYLINSGSRRLPTLEILTTPDERGRTWLESITRDPWDKDYEIREGDSRSGISFEVVSAGPNGLMGDEDDISSNKSVDRK